MTLSLDRAYGPLQPGELPLPPRTTLAEALDRYGQAGYDSTLRERSFGFKVAGLTPAWYERHQARTGRADELRELIRAQAIDAANDAATAIQVPHVDQLREIIYANAEDYAARRQAEQLLAGRMKDAALELERAGELARPMADQAERMMLCRVCGHVGVKEGGAHLVAWEFKCGDSRLCPDEAREHVRWEARRYIPGILEWRKAAPRRRVFYAVFTTPNATSLEAGIEHIFSKWRTFLDAERDCTDLDREQYGYSKRKKKLQLWRPAPREEGQPYAGPGIHGALVQLEAPLSARGDWNGHLNAVLLVEGGFDFELARKVWGCNVELKEVQGDERELAEAMLELIKYAARHIGEKSQAKADAGDSQAPPLVDWPAARLWEFYQAAHGSRWLRSYGVLHGIPEPVADAPKVVWIGRLTFTDAGAYWVDLIQGPNFSDSPPQIAQVPGYRVPNIRPPPELRPRSPP